MFWERETFFLLACSRKSSYHYIACQEMEIPPLALFLDSSDNLVVYYAMNIHPRYVL